MKLKAGEGKDSKVFQNIEEALSYSRSNSDRYLEELKDFLRIPSVGTDPKHEGDTIAAARWLADSMKSAGLENVRVIQSDGMPLVYGDWLNAGQDRPTVLVYGHYDVQPADPLDEWLTPPFEPTIIEDFLHCRGASDDKGQMFIHIKSLESYLKGAGSLPVNVKCLFEGEEEAGGEAIEAFVRGNAALLSADAIILSDTSLIDKEYPAIVYGIRGNCYAFVDVFGPEHDLHSGSLGGVVDNPLNALAHIVSKLRSEDGVILIPGFYDSVQDLSDIEKQSVAQNPIDEQQILSETGSPNTWGEPGYSIAERLGSRPTLDVHGLTGGFTGQGQKTIIPSHGHAKISMRLVPNQKALEIFSLFESYVRKIAPDSVRVEVTYASGADPSVLDIHGRASLAAAEAYEYVFGRQPAFIREGGSIPVVALFEEVLSINSVMMGFGLPDDRIHAPNERFYLPNFYKGIETVMHFYNEMSVGSET